MNDDIEYVISPDNAVRLVKLLREAEEPHVPFSRDQKEMLQAAYDKRGQLITGALNVLCGQKWWPKIENQTRPPR